MLLIAGICFLQKAAAVKKKLRILIRVLIAGMLFSMFSASDFLGEFHGALHQRKGSRRIPAA